MEVDARPWMSSGVGDIGACLEVSMSDMEGVCRGGGGVRTVAGGRLPLGALPRHSGSAPAMARGCVWLWLGWAGLGWVWIQGTAEQRHGHQQRRAYQNNKQKEIDIRGFESSGLIPRLIAANN